MVPSTETFHTAAAHADWSATAGFYMVPRDQPGKGSWPIVGASYVLVRREQPDAEKARAMLQFFDWCFKDGADLAAQLHYVPIPEAVWGLVESAWKKEIKAEGGASAVWK